MFILDKTFLNPSVEVILGLDTPKSLLLLINVDDIDIRFVLMSLNEILYHITLAYTPCSNNSNDIAFPYPRIHNISVVFPCYHFHSIDVLCAKIINPLFIDVVVLGIKSTFVFIVYIKQNRSYILYFVQLVSKLQSFTTFSKKI